MIRRGEREDEHSRFNRRRFREVLLEDEAGRYVLGAILMDLGYFEPAQDDRQRVLRNYAQRLLDHLGVTHEVSVLDFVDAIKQIPVYQGEETDSE